MTDSPVIAAVLAWYDEEPRVLERMVASLTGVADVLVSLDGPYADYPHERIVSPSEQRCALDSACRDAGIEHRALTVTSAETQAAKRTRLYRAAAEAADWLLIIDADEEMRCEGAAIRWELGHDYDAASVAVRTGDGIDCQPRLIRALRDITCGPEYHGMLSATDDDGRRVCIRDRRSIIMDSRPRPRRARTLDVAGIAEIINHTSDRPAERIAAKREYINRRTQSSRDL